ncbi:hypothetical protein AB0H71_33845 [Nocardia sp. NPDC050697]|uniref:hypothetical protein n=1 Tax=Nocardia sp. NPDC050697 TaxID=3155158 RepID=UPI0034057C95
MANADERHQTEGNPPAITGEESRRSYRKMPNPDDLAGQYARLGTVTAVANHYGVPRHTAQGWVGRLRKLNKA